MARRTLTGVVQLAALVAVAACVEREPQAPPASPQFAVQAGAPTDPTTCSFSNITSLVLAYFPGPRQNTVRALVTAMEDAEDFSAAARDKAFDIMTHIDTVVTNGTAGAPATGSNLVNALIYCMYNPSTADTIHRPATFPEDFTEELDPSLHGAFGVRGGAGDPVSAPVLSRPLATAFTGVAPGDTFNWVTTVIDFATPERVLVYGRTVFGELDEYEWKTLPHDATFTPNIVVGFCLDDVLFPTSMVQMENSVLAFQAVTFLPSGCSNTAVLRSGWQERFASVARFGARLFSPRPLWATIVNPGGLGGSTGGIRSKFRPLDLNATAGGVTLKFEEEPPPNVKVNATFTVSVKATTGTAPVAGVSVKLEQFNNNGVPATLSGVNPVVTGPDGVAMFTLSLDKTGAYVLRTTSESTVLGRDGITITGTESRKFNVKAPK